MIYHVSLKFSTAEHGWVEQLYRQDSTLASALAAGVVLARARYTILGDGVLLHAVRVTVPGLPRTVASADVSDTPLGVPAMLAVEGAEIRLTGGEAPSHRRSYFLRGLPAGSIVDPLGASRWAPTWSAAILGWLARLADGHWVMKCRGYVGPRLPLVGLYPLAVPDLFQGEDQAGLPGVSGWTQAGLAVLDQAVTVPLVDTATGAPPRVRIGLVRWSDLAAARETPINGEYDTIASFAQSLQYVGAVPAVGEYVGGGYAQVSQCAYLKICSAILTRAGTRHCGPPTSPLPIPAAPAAPAAGGVPGITSAVLLGALAAVAVTRLPPSIRPSVILPPVVPPVVPPPFPPPVSGTLTNAQDALMYIYNELTFSGVGPLYRPIGIAKILNLPNTWWVGLAGLYIAEGTNAGLLTAFTAGLGQLNQYSESVQALIEFNVPSDATLVIQGFSLGGMTAENVANLREFRDRVIQVTTFGSPITMLDWDRAPIVRLKVRDDLVPTFTPLGLASSIAGDLGYTIVAADPDFDSFPSSHTRMAFNSDLARFDNYGRVPTSKPPFVLGFLRKFAAGP